VTVDAAWRSSVGRAESFAGVLALALVACRSQSVAIVDRAAAYRCPSSDVGESCSDVSDLRVCWSADGPRLVPRPVPPFPPPTEAGFRCTGPGPARTCDPRAALAGPFACSGATCVQAHPRQPDDGEWTCSDDAGVTVCVGSERAAGTLASEPAPGWICGARRRPAALNDRFGASVCIDLSPDFPDGHASGFRCRWVYEQGLSRECSRDPSAHAVGDACDAMRPCVGGAACVASRCLPLSHAPSCWLDTDCPSGVCRFGSCLGVDR
jgi:hypothetical protein